MADAILARADHAIRSGDYNTALRYVDRALWLDHTYPQSATRLGFLGETTRDTSLLERAVSVESDALLRRHDSLLSTTYADDLRILGRYDQSARMWELLANT